MDYEVGDIIEYETGSAIRRVRVTARHEDINHGEPGFDAVFMSGQSELGKKLEVGDGVWGYDEQIVRVVAK
jgi:hypothetical protein